MTPQTKPGPGIGIGAGGQSGEIDEDQVRLVKSFAADARQTRVLRRALRSLRDQATDPAVADAITDVIQGRESFYRLWHSPAFQGQIAPAMDRIVQAADAMSPEEDAQARAAAVARREAEDAQEQEQEQERRAR
jgi:hypothetical protein